MGKSNPEIKIRILKNVRPETLSLVRSGTILRMGNEYDTICRENGAIIAICDNGERLGVKPDEFEFLIAPQLLLSLWDEQCDGPVCITIELPDGMTQAERMDLAVYIHDICDKLSDDDFTLGEIGMPECEINLLIRLAEALKMVDEK